MLFLATSCSCTPLSPKVHHPTGGNRKKIKLWTKKATIESIWTWKIRQANSPNFKFMMTGSERVKRQSETGNHRVVKGNIRSSIPTATNEFSTTLTVSMNLSRHFKMFKPSSTHGSTWGNESMWYAICEIFPKVWYPIWDWKQHQSIFKCFSEKPSLDSFTVNIYRLEII